VRLEDADAHRDRAAVRGTDPARTSNGDPPGADPEDLAATLGPAAGPGLQTALARLANSRPAASLRQRRPAVAFRSGRRQYRSNIDSRGLSWGYAT
jgi:hypothetical protein